MSLVPVVSVVSFSSRALIWLGVGALLPPAIDIWVHLFAGTSLLGVRNRDQLSLVVRLPRSVSTTFRVHAECKHDCLDDLRRIEEC